VKKLTNLAAIKLLQVKIHMKSFLSWYLLLLIKWYLLLLLL